MMHKSLQFIRNFELQTQRIKHNNVELELL